jgi:hypothetical protein
VKGVLARSHRDKEREPVQSAEQRVLPMQLQLGDRLVEATGLWEVITWPSLSKDGKTTHVRVRRVAQPDLIEFRSWGSHERVSLRRA